MPLQSGEHGSNHSETQEQPPTVAQVYEHLFPGKKYKDMPLLTPDGTLFKNYYLAGYKARRLRFQKAHDQKRAYAERHNIKFAQLSAKALLGGLSPREATINGCQVNNHNFSDLIDQTKGEYFGGVAVRDESALLIIQEIFPKISPPHIQKIFIKHKLLEYWIKIIILLA